MSYPIQGQVCSGFKLFFCFFLELWNLGHTYIHLEQSHSKQPSAFAHNLYSTVHRHAEFVNIPGLALMSYTG